MRVWYLLLVLWVVIFVNFQINPNLRIFSKHDNKTEELEKYRRILQFTSNKQLGAAHIPIGFIKESIRENGTLLAGKCVVTLQYPFREIEININYWKLASFESKLLLLAHEFGHCECGLMHKDLKDKNGCPYSYMSTYTSSDKCNKDNFYRYIKEMEKGCR